MDAITKMKKRQKVIQWHRAIILTSCCLIMVVDAGLIISFGTLFTDLMSTFNSSRAETSIVQSASISVLMLSGVIAGILVKKFGCVIIGCFGSLLFSFSLMACFFASTLIFVIISVGMFSGVGLSCLYICTSEVISRDFSGKRRLLYMSLLATSVGIGGTMYPYLLRYLSDLYGCRGVLLLVGAISLNAFPGCFVLKQQTKQYTPLMKTDSYCENNAAQVAKFEKCMKVKTKVSDEKVSIKRTDHTDTQVSDSIFVVQFPVLKDEANTRMVTVRDARKPPSHICNIDSILLNHIKSVLRNTPFMLVVVGSMLAIPSFNVILILAGDIYKDNGLTNDDLSFGFVLLNIFNIIGRIFLGIVLQSKYIPTLFVSVASAVLFLLFTLIKTRSIVLALTALSGVPIGMFRSMFTVLTLKLVGSNLLPIAVGISFTLNGISNLVSGPVNGFIRDITGSYILSFYVGMAVNLVAAFVFFLAHMIRRNKKKRKRHTNSTVFYLTSF